MKFSLLAVLGVGIAAALHSVNPTVEQDRANLQSATRDDRLATETEQRLKHFHLDKNHLAIEGYDPVSYFKSGPQKGSSSLAYTYKGVVYYFANSANQAEFKTNPDKYEPVWGGWCGHAMAVRGEKVEINPECYKIVNGRNVLFFKTFYANALSNWEKEIKTTPENTLMKQGDDFWKNTLTK